MKREFSGQIFEKYSNIMKICSMGAEFYVRGRTDRQREYSQADRHDETKCRSSQFCERAYNCYIISVLVVIILILRISLNCGYTAR